MLRTSKYGNPYYYLVSGIILIMATSYLRFENPGDIFQMFLLIVGFIFVITGIAMLVYNKEKRN